MMENAMIGTITGNTALRAPRPGAQSRAMATLARIAVVSSLTALVLPATTLTSQSGSFGNSVVIADGEIIIGEPNPTFRSGSVYIYEKTGGRWGESEVLRAPDSERADGFGTVLAKADNTLFIGQRGGPLHIFERGADGNWRATSVLQGDDVAGHDPGCGQYGYCGTDFGLTLAADDDWLLVGAPGAAPDPQGQRRNQPEQPEVPGAVHAYERDGGAWIRRATLQPSDGMPGDGFGSAIVLTPQGALIGAPRWTAPTSDLEGLENAGRVYHFRLAEGGWEQVGALEAAPEANANYGSAIAAADGRVLVGAPGANESRGAVFAHSWNGDLARWAPEADAFTLPNGGSGDRFGAAVAFAGGDIWVGAPTTRGYETGSVYVYTGRDDGTAPADPRRIQLAREETVEQDRFGGLIVANTEVVAVGAPGMHHQSGSIHLYERGDDSGAGDPPPDVPASAWQDAGTLVSAPDALDALLGEERRCIDGMVGPFDCNEVELLSFIPNSILRDGVRARGVRTNDNWGWTDPVTGREYALVGRNDGTSFIDITDPSNPVLVGDLPKPWGTPPSQLWRDIKTYRDHAYIVADGAGEHGMQVFDLTRLRDVAPDEMPALLEPDTHYLGIASSHNIVINEESGFAYAVGNRGGGESCGGGLHMMDIRDPKNPVFVGCSAHERGTHDSQCVIYQGPDERYHDRELCLNSNGAFFEISDVTDKDNPVAVARASSPNYAYIHQGWLTPDHRYFFQDDESDVLRGSVQTTRTLIWDLTDLEEPILIREFMGSMPASAHNLYLKDGYAYQANYRYGLHVLDISDPVNPREAGYFDTSPYQEGPGFSGAWSTYPFFESGTVIVTSLQEGLFVLKRRVRPVS